MLHSFLHQTAQFREHRRVGVGLVVLLVADALHRHQAAVGQAFEFALDGAGAGADAGDQFGGVEAASGLAEQQGQDPLLGGGEQGVGQAGGRGGMGVCPAVCGPAVLYCCRVTHCEQYSTRYG